MIGTSSRYAEILSDSEGAGSGGELPAVDEESQNSRSSSSSSKLAASISVCNEAAAEMSLSVPLQDLSIEIDRELKVNIDEK